MSTYAEILNISLIAAASPVYSTPNIHKFTIEWGLPDQLVYDTSYIRVYRYIGDKNTCVEDIDLPVPPSTGSTSNGRTRLIYEVAQNFNTSNQALSTYRIKSYNFDGSEGAVTNGLSSLDLRLRTYTDNFASVYSDSSSILKTAYSIIDADTDRQLLNNIYTTERTLFYIVATYRKNGTIPNVGEVLYGYDIDHPLPSAPVLSLGLTGSNDLAFVETSPQCYPWPLYNSNALPSIQPDDLVISFIDEADEDSDFRWGGSTQQDYINNGNKTTNPLALSHEVSGKWIEPNAYNYYPSYVYEYGSYTSRDATNYSNTWLQDVSDWKIYVDDIGYNRNNFLGFNVCWYATDYTNSQYLTGYSSITPGQITAYDLGYPYGSIWASRCPELTAASVSAVSGTPIEIVVTPRATNPVVTWEGQSLTTAWLTGQLDSKFDISNITPKRLIIFIDVSGSMKRSNIEGPYWIDGLEKWSPPVGGDQYGALEGAIAWLEDKGFPVTIYYCDNERWLRWIINAVRDNASICSETISQKRTFATAVTAYDDMKAIFTLYVNAGTFIIKDWNLNVDDYGYVLKTINNNNIYLTSPAQYTTYVDISHSYNTPGVGGREYLDNDVIHTSHISLPGWENGPVTPKTKDLYTSGVSSGHFIATAWITAQNVYKTPSGTCELFTSSATNDLLIYERWPEPRFFLDITDNASFRKEYFHAPAYIDDNRYDKSDDLVRLSGKSDAIRKDVIIGVEPLSAIIEDRSISRTYPISSWLFTISTDNQWLQNDPIKSFKIDHTTSGLNDTADTQSDYIPLTGFTFQYGANVVSLTAAASSTSTISDRLFSQCVNVKEMNPIAMFDVVSGQTIINGSVSSISGYNAWFNGDSAMGYISGYAPFLNVYFAEKSYANTFPISSYHWNFGDIYNEGPDSIYDPQSNYYTLTTTTVMSGGFSWNVPPKELPLWKTDISNITASHTYIMPGRYNATLMVKASNTGTMDTYGKYINDEYHYEIYVEEVMPSCGNILMGLSSTSLTSAISTISGTGPLTAYFGITGLTEGSFPICQLRWQIGDHIETITRYPSATQTSQGLDIINPTSITDAIIPFVLDPLVTQSYNVGISAVVCNTNTVIDCTPVNNSTGTIISKYEQGISNFTLLKSRIDEYGNIIYLFGDSENNSTHTIMLTGELSGI